MATLNDYKGSVDLVAGLRAISTGYPLMEAHDIQVEEGDVRLDAKLYQLASSIGDINEIASSSGSTTWSRIKALEDGLGLITNNPSLTGKTAWSRIRNLENELGLNGNTNDSISTRISNLETKVGNSTDSASALNSASLNARIKQLRSEIGDTVSGTTIRAQISDIYDQIGSSTHTGIPTTDLKNDLWQSIIILNAHVGNITDKSTDSNTYKATSVHSRINTLFDRVGSEDDQANATGSSVWSRIKYVETELGIIGSSSSSVESISVKVEALIAGLGKITDTANVNGTTAWSRIKALEAGLGKSSDTANATGTTAWSRINAIQSGLGKSNDNPNVSGTTAWSRINAIQSGLGVSSDNANANGTTAWSQINSLKSELQTVKTSVSNGKSAVASAITDKMVSTSDSDSFATMATNIGKIETAPPNGKKWDVVNAHSTGYTHISIVYANECFYLFSKLSSSTKLQVFINTDPYNYPVVFVDKTSSVSSNATNFYKVVYGNGMFVGYNTSNKIFYSRDALTWTQALSISNAGFYNLSFSYDRFLIYSSSGIKYSLDGITWNSGSSTYPFSSSYLLSSNIIYNGTYYMLVAANTSSTTCNTLYVSRDLDAWLSVALENAVGNNPVILWNNSKVYEYDFIIIAGANYIYLIHPSIASSLSITYFNKQSNTWGITPTGIIYNDTATIIYSNTSSNSKFLYNNMKRVWTNSSLVTGASLSVETWRPYNFVNNSVISDIAYGYNIFIAIGNNGSNGVITYSRNEQLYYDDQEWEILTRPSTSFDHLVYFNGKLFGIDESEWYLYNKNSNEFEKVGDTEESINTFNVYEEIGQVINNVTYDGRYIYFLYPTAKIFYTADGTNFTHKELYINNAKKALFLRYGDGKLIGAISDTSNDFTLFCYSTSNMSSNNVTFSKSFVPLDCAYGNGKYVIIGISTLATSSSSTNKAAYSTNGTTWTEITMPAEARWYNIKYGNGIFVAIGYGANNNGVIAYSTNGTTFTLVDRDPSIGNYFTNLQIGTLPSYDNYKYFHELTYGGGKFIITYPYDINYTDNNNITHYTSLVVIHSKDGKIWKPYIYEHRSFWSISYPKLVYCEDSFALHFGRTNDNTIYISKDKND